MFLSFPKLESCKNCDKLGASHGPMQSGLAFGIYLANKCIDTCDSSIHELIRILDPPQCQIDQK